MKKLILSMASAAIVLTGCTGMGQTGTGASALGSLLGGGAANTTTTALAGAGTNLLGRLIGNLTGANTLNDQNIVGNWQYRGIDCVFESQNVLSQIGGEVAASALENKLDTNLQKIGIKPGSCAFTFNSDHTWTGTVAGKTLSGQWALDAQRSQMQMTYLAGLGTLTPKVALNNGTLSLLFESTKILTLAQGVGALTKSTAANTLSSLLGNYNGMYVGLQLAK